MVGWMAKKGGGTHGRRTRPRAWRPARLAAILMGVLLAGGSLAWAQAEHVTAGIKPPHGFRSSGPPETYGPDTLYEKINGQAELYLSAGFVGLESQWYEAIDDAGTIIEVNLYNMGSLVNAFAVFSRQRRDDAPPTDAAVFSYQTDSALYLVHGPFYVEIVSTLTSGTHQSLLTALAEQIVREIPVTKADLPLLELFPPEKQVKGSASMIAEDAFGFDALDHVFTVAYDTPAGRLTAWISRRKTAQDARGLVSGLHAFFEQYGGRRVAAGIPVQGGRMLEVMGTFEVMFSYGEYAAGVHEAPDRKQAEKMAGSLAGSLKAKTRETAH